MSDSIPARLRPRGSGGGEKTARRAPWYLRRFICAVVLAPSLTGCTTLDRAVAVVPWFTTMRDQIGPRAFEAAWPGDSLHRFLAPEGSVPTGGIEDSLDIYGAGLRAVDAMRNPETLDDASSVRAQDLFDTYCSVCHGVQGQGNGPVAQRLGFVPDLTQDMTRQRSDGYIYAVIRHGRGLMPRYGDKIINTRDRWLVVSYVRRLQGRQQPAQGAAQ